MKTIIDLVSEDLITIATPQEAHVASEETIRLFIDYYNKNDNFNGVYVRADDLDKLFEKLLEAYNGIDVKRYNIVLQTGERSQTKFKSHYTAHYAAITLEIDSQGAKVAFADHYRANPSYLTISDCIKKYNLKTYKFYGAALQKDTSHCYMFTLEHLLQLNSQANLFERLELLADNNGNIQWSKTPIELQWAAQSFTYLWQQVDVKFQENPYHLLRNHGIREEDFPSIVSENIIVDSSKDHRVFNGVINGVSAKYARVLYLALQNNEYSINDVLRISYQESHPEIFNFLMGIRKGWDNISNVHPISDFIFNNIQQAKACFKNRKLCAIFQCDAVAELVESGKLSYTDILSELIINFDKQFDSNKFELNVTMVNRFYDNLSVIDRTAALNEEDILPLLTHKNIKNVFQVEQIYHLIQSKHLPLEEALKLIPFKIKLNDLNGKTKEQQADYLLAQLSQNQHQRTASVKFNLLDVACAVDDVVFDIFAESESEQSEDEECAMASLFCVS